MPRENTKQQPYIYSCVLTEFTSPFSLNTQRGWHTSELRILALSLSITKIILVT